MVKEGHRSGQDVLPNHTSKTMKPLHERMVGWMRRGGGGGGWVKMMEAESWSSYSTLQPFCLSLSKPSFTLPHALCPFLLPPSISTLVSASITPSLILDAREAESWSSIQRKDRGWKRGPWEGRRDRDGGGRKEEGRAEYIVVFLSPTFSLPPSLPPSQFNN